jgi:hypothetical protein
LLRLLPSLTQNAFRLCSLKDTRSAAYFKMTSLRDDLSGLCVFLMSQLCFGCFLRSRRMRSVFARSRTPEALLILK